MGPTSSRRPREDGARMADNVLILHPRDPLYAPSDADVVVELLEREGLVGTSSRDDLPSGERRRFRTGPGFERLLTFNEVRKLRTRVDGKPGGDDHPDRNAFIRDVCEVLVVGPLDREWLIASSYTEDPVCPGCGAKADWNAIANDWYNARSPSAATGDALAACSVCGIRALPWEFDWRESAAFVRFYIEVWHIRANEAAPTRDFIAQLEAVTDTPWAFLYYRL